MECMFEYMSCVIKNLAHGVKWAGRVPGSHDWSVLAAGTSFGLAWTLFSPLVISRLILDPRIKRWLSMSENLLLVEASLISTRWISLHLLRTGRECFAVGAQHYQNMLRLEIAIPICTYCYGYYSSLFQNNNNYYLAHLRAKLDHL